jgi:MFS family permease
MAALDGGTMNLPASIAAPRPAALYWSLAVLTIVSFLNYLDRMVLAVLLPPIRQELQLSDTQLGLLSGLAFALLFAILGLPLARIADRRSRVGLLGICLAVWSGMTALTGFAHSFTQLFLARVGVGIGEAGCIPAAHSLLGDYFPKRRALAISVFQAGALAGVSAGLLITGMLAQNFGWRAALMLVGAAGLPVVLLVMTLREPARQGASAALREPAIASMLALMRRGGFAHLVIAISIGGFGNYGIGQWLPSFYVRSFGLTLQQVGAWTGMAAAIGGIGGVLFGGVLAVRLMARDPRWELWLPMIVYPAAAPLYACMFLSPSLPLAIAMNIAGGFVVAMGGGVALSSLQSFAEPNRRAMAVALAMFASSLIGLGLGPLGVGVLSDALAGVAGSQSLRYALLGSTVTLLWAGLHFHFAAHRYERDRVPG